MTQPAASTIHNLRLLRAVAAVAVVVQHLGTLAQDSALPDTANGAILFFVISGYIFARPRQGGSIKLFALHRATRIVPLYWMVTTFAFCVALVAPAVFNRTVADVSDLARSLLFIPFMRPGDTEPLPLLRVGWSLNYEVFFYALIGVAIWRRLSTVIFVCAIILTLVGLGMLMRPTSAIAAFYTSPILLTFVVGMLVAQFARKNAIPSEVGVALVAALLPGVLFGSPVVAGIASGGMVLGAVSAERGGLRLKFANKLGDASYALYLTHPFLTSSTLLVYKKIGSPGMLAFPILLGCVTAAIVVALVIHAHVDHPLTRWLRSRIKRAHMPLPAGTSRSSYPHPQAMSE